MKYLTLAILCVCFCNSLQESNLVRKTKYGKVRGELLRSLVDPSIEYYSFKGVPYALPPVGKLRFKEPLPPKKWSGIREANESAAWCVQISEWFMGTAVNGSEDCLYVEIYEPKTVKPEGQKLMPVLAWIHGGTYLFGTATNNDPDYLMEQPAVIVSIGYRLNVFGFLSTQDKHAKGNNGLKDQRLALKWIQENIKNFGGDPKSVTIFGCSAGGASGQHHMLSPGSKGLFHKVISQSGSTLNRWGLQAKPLKMAHRLAKGLGIQAIDSKSLIKELQEIDYQTLIWAAFNQSIVGFYTPYSAQPFGPSIESESKTAIVSESTFHLLAKGKIASKVPYITGFTTEEGSFGYTYIDNGRVDINIYEQNPGFIIPVSMNINKHSYCYNKTIDQIRAHFFKNGSFTDKVNWINYMSQDLFVRGITKSIEFTHQLTPLYLYRFSHVATNNPTSYIGGVGHYEEVSYLWKKRPASQSWNMSASDTLTSKRLVKLWINFAATGNPTPERDELLQNVTWPKITSRKAFLDIGDNLIVSENPDPHYQFWNQLFAECANAPYLTY